MFSTKYTCNDCGKETKVKKFFFSPNNLSCSACGSKKLTKVEDPKKSSCGCGSNKKNSFFT